MGTILQKVFSYHVLINKQIISTSLQSLPMGPIANQLEFV